MDNNGYDHDMSVRNNNQSRRKELEANTPTQMTATEVKAEKFRIYRNVLIISFSFLLLFVAFESMSKLQSSINTVGGLGVWSNAMVYASLILSCMFLPSIMIEKLTVKWALVVSVFCYSSYIAAQFYPEFYTLLPTAFVLGLGAAPMWSAKCTYLTQVAHRFAKLEGSDPEAVVVKFFGIFFFFFQCNAILGNIISTAVLSSGNETYVDLSDAQMALCGSQFCPQAAAPAVVEDETLLAPLVGGLLNATLVAAADEATTGNDNFKTATWKIYIIAGIYLACSVSAAILIALFVDPLDRFGTTDEKKEKPKLSGLQLLMATFKQMKRKEQLLIIPITFWSGIEQGFFGADFTAGFVTCAYGVHTVGKVLIVFGVCDASASIITGFIIKTVGRLPIFIFGACINLLVIVVMLTWTPTAATWYVVYILAALWGVGDAIWQTQINALYGCLFANDEEAAFSNYRLWESLGFLFAFITNAMGVCVLPKIVTTIIFLVLGMVGYLTVEYLERGKEPVRHN